MNQQKYYEVDGVWWNSRNYATLTSPLLKGLTGYGADLIYDLGDTERVAAWERYLKANVKIKTPNDPVDRSNAQLIWDWLAANAPVELHNDRPQRGAIVLAMKDMEIRYEMKPPRKEK